MLATTKRIERANLSLRGRIDPRDFLLSLVMEPLERNPQARAAYAAANAARETTSALHRAAKR